MLDYCLLITFLQNEIESYRFIGEDFRLHSKVNESILYRQALEQDPADLLLLYKQSSQQIELFLKHHLNEDFKWVFIVPDEKHIAANIYRDIREIGDVIYVNDVTPFIIIKNLKDNFKNYFRTNLLEPFEKKNLEEFLNFNIPEQNLTHTETISGNDEEALCRSLVSNSLFMYIGKPISNECLKKCQTIANMKLYLIECIDSETLECVGFFCHKDFIQKAWLFKLTQYNILKNIFNFSSNYIKIPV